LLGGLGVLEKRRKTGSSIPSPSENRNTCRSELSLLKAQEEKTTDEEEKNRDNDGRSQKKKKGRVLLPLLRMGGRQEGFFE